MWFSWIFLLGIYSPSSGHQIYNPEFGQTYGERSTQHQHYQPLSSAYSSFKTEDADRLASHDKNHHVKTPPSYPSVNGDHIHAGRPMFVHRSQSPSEAHQHVAPAHLSTKDVHSSSAGSQHHSASLDLYKEDLSDYDSLIHTLHTEKATSLFVDFFEKDQDGGNKVRQMRKYSDKDDFNVDQSLLLPNDSLSYNVLSNTPHGRQLLLVTLLEGFDTDCWQPRCMGYIELYLPPSLKADNQPEPGPDACLLKDIVHKGRKWTRRDVLNIFNNIAASKVQKNQQYSRFKPSHVKSVNSVVKLCLAQESFDSLLSLLTVLKDYCNPRVFSEAVMKIIQARRDTGFVVPSLRSISPADYFPEFKGESSDRTGRSHTASLFGNSRQNSSVRWFSFRTTHRTISPQNPESELWHFREDSKVNTMHTTWHLLLSDPNADFIMRRRGEMFAFMHKQLINRYNVDRLAVGLGGVRPYMYEDWVSPTLFGYNSRLSAEIAPNVLFYPPRLYGQRMSDSDAMFLRNSASAIYQSIHQMSINNTRLGYANGVDFGISPLSDVVEPFPDLAAVGASPFHNLGHVIIAEMSINAERAGVMGFVETAMRDPVFYKWHKLVDMFFDEYKKLLGPYRNELEFPGVTISDLSTYSGGRRNTLRTFVEWTSMELDSNLLRTMNGTRLMYERINHDPNIEIRMRLHSTMSGSGIARLFLIPASHINEPDMISYVIEMDRFYVELYPGVINIRRRLEDSVFFSAGAPSLTELQNQLLRGMTELEFNYANCGWPLELALPRGNRQGQKFYLVAMISELLPGDRDSVAEWMALDQISWGWCGIRQGDGSMPDNRPMGFPFDRPTTLKQMLLPNRKNFKATPVTIYHV